MAPPVRTIELHEREVRPFARSDLIDASGRSLILPETRELSAVEVKDAGEDIQLRVLGLIGYLPLTSEIALNLRPKFPTDSLWYMLDIAEEAYDEVLPLIRTYERSDEVAPHHLLARAFSHYVGELLAAGVWRGYHPVTREGYFQPKVAFGRTLGRFLARGDQISTVSDAFAFSLHSPANAYLKSACIRFLKIIPRVEGWREERQLLSQALEALAGVRQAPMYPADHVAAEEVPMRVRAQYRGALLVYAMLLGHGSVGFSYDAAGAPLPSFLFCLDDVFEAFVRNVCRAGFRQHGVAVADGNVPRNQVPLFIDNKRYPTKPDLIFRRDGRTAALGEVKYKPRIEEADRYQLISHVSAAGAPIGVWISPALGEEAASLDYVGALGTGAKFYHYRLPLGKDLRGGSARMVETLWSDLVEGYLSTVEPSPELV